MCLCGLVGDELFFILQFLSPPVKVLQAYRYFYGKFSTDREPRNPCDSLPTSMDQTPCPDSRHPPTQTNHLLRVCICQETRWSPTSSIQGSNLKQLTEDRNRSGKLLDGSCRKNQLKKCSLRKKQH